MKANVRFINRDDVDFDLASDLSPVETINIIPPYESTHIDITEYPVKRVNFNNVRNITLFIQDNWSGGEEEVSRLWYLGFKGTWTELKDTPLLTVFEVYSLIHSILTYTQATPNPADHKKVKAERNLR